MKAADVEGSNDGRTWTKLAGGDSLVSVAEWRDESAYFITRRRVAIAAHHH